MIGFAVVSMLVSFMCTSGFVISPNGGPFGAQEPKRLKFLCIYIIYIKNTFLDFQQQTNKRINVNESKYEHRSIRDQ